MATQRKNSETGFTLPEIALVLGLISVIIGFSITYSMNSIVRANGQSEQDMYVSLLSRARARAMANVGEAAHGVYIDTDHRQYITYRQNSGCGNATTSSQSVTMPSNATVSGPRNVCFGQLSIRVPSTHTGTTTFSLSGQLYNVSVNTVGRIDW